MKTLITNGQIITATDNYKADIFIDGETITTIGVKLDMEADVTIDASGKYVIPGGIDPHTHMELPFGGTTAADDFRTGTIAAAHGGTTSIIDFAVQYKGESLIQGLDNWHKKAEGKCAIDYGFHLITTELEDKQIEEMYTVMDEGVTSFKLFMAYPGVFLVDDATIYRAPDRFDPDRFAPPRAEQLKHPMAFIPQGAEPPTGHRCLGLDYSTILSVAFLALLLRGYEWELPPQDLEYSWKSVPPVPRDGLRVRLSQRTRDAPARPGIPDASAPSTRNQEPPRA